MRPEDAAALDRLDAEVLQAVADVRAGAELMKRGLESFDRLAAGRTRGFIAAQLHLHEAVAASRHAANEVVQAIQLGKIALSRAN